LDISVISTGCLPLDLALVWRSAGKYRDLTGTSENDHCAFTIAQAQKHGGVAAFIDAGTRGSYLGRTYRCQVDELLISAGQRRREIESDRSGGIDVLVIDR
jgi:recombination protein RecA